MNSSYIQTLLNKDIKTVSVSFGNSTSYTYKTRLDLVPDDLVIVKAAGKFKIARIEEIDCVPNIDANSSIQYAWIMQKVETVAYENKELEDLAFKRKVKEEEIRTHREQHLQELKLRFGNLNSLIENKPQSDDKLTELADEEITDLGE